MKESAVTNHVRLRAAQLGIYLWRNNSGGFYDENGRFVRYGLGNFIPEKDKKASPDFIGMTPVVVQPWMVGMTLAVFTAVEIKEEGWVYRPSDKRALYQSNFIDIVKRVGGYGGFATCPDDMNRIIAR